MITLGIETTAHTFGVGIIKDKEILANVKDTYTTESGGIIPIQAAEHHKRIKEKVLNEALENASITLNDVDLISFSQGPGLGPCLRVGSRFAAGLSFKNKIPLVGVNHCIAHLEVGSLVSEVNDPVLMYVSGANTQIIAYESGKYRIFGETLDMGVGNFLDSFARFLGIGFPGGPKVSKLADKGRKFVKLPYVVKGMDISVSGILTNLKQKVEKINKGKADYSINDLCYSVQEDVFSMILEVTERAVFHCGKKEVLMGGGVSCNKKLQEMVKIMGEEDNLKVFIPPNNLLSDNGVMIAWLGYKMFKTLKDKGEDINKLIIKSSKQAEDIEIKPYERTDEVKVYWKD